MLRDNSKTLGIPPYLAWWVTCGALVQGANRSDMDNILVL